MSDNCLIIAAAGSGKTSLLVDAALADAGRAVLITTYTEANESEIVRRLHQRHGCVPKHVTVQTWFSFLLQHGVRPYQSVLHQELHDRSIGLYFVNQKSGYRVNANGDPILVNGRRHYWGEDDNFRQHYFTATWKLYSDKLSKFVCSTNAATEGEVIRRIARIYTHVLVDEVQDLAGYDLDVIKLLCQAECDVTLVGDPRQVTYRTHPSAKHKKYGYGRIKEFVKEKVEREAPCEVNEELLSVSHRCSDIACKYSSRLFPTLPTPSACLCCEDQRTGEHAGVFVVPTEHIDSYVERFNPMQLRWSASRQVHRSCAVRNFGEAKGATWDRVIIYPTKAMSDWVGNNDSDLTDEACAKLYVALTRARVSTTIAVVSDVFQPDEAWLPMHDFEERMRGESHAPPVVAVGNVCAGRVPDHAASVSASQADPHQT